MICSVFHLISIINRGAETLVQQAREWESSGEYLRAIECYVKVDRQQTNDQNVMHKCWMKVSKLHLTVLTVYSILQTKGIPDQLSILGMSIGG